MNGNSPGWTALSAWSIREPPMSDDQRKQDWQTGKRNRTNDNDQLRYWSEKWKVSQDEVKRAIRKVGPMVKDVARELGRA